MSRDRSPACKKCRRAGIKLFLKGDRCHTAKCAVEKRNYPPGIRNLRRRVSEYGVRLIEKQKLRHYYGLGEKQLRNAYEAALTSKGVTGNNLLRRFECRLDSVIFKSGITSSRKAARQFVLHNHFLLNGKKANIPSMALKEGDVLQLKHPQSDFSKVIEEQLKGSNSPDWLELNSKEKCIKVIRAAKVEELDAPVNIQLIIEYYSR